MLKAKPATIVRLSQPVFDGKREHDTLFLAGKPGSSPLPLMVNGDEMEIDVLAVERIVCERTSLPQSTVRKLVPIDLFTVMLTLFGPASAGRKR